MAKKAIDLTALTAGAALKEAAAAPVMSKPVTKSKLISALPVALEERYAKLRADGKTSLLFSAYMIEALREKLERDESR